MNIYRGFRRTQIEVARVMCSTARLLHRSSFFLYEIYHLFRSIWKLSVPLYLAACPLEEVAEGA